MTELSEVSIDFDGATLVSSWLPAATELAPAILIFPTVLGVSDFEIGIARKLNALGYGAMVADTFGLATRGVDRQAMFDEMGRMTKDRGTHRRRVTALLNAMLAQHGVDPSRVAAIGYCFGGLCALDLARSGARIGGVASFHGALDPTGLEPVPITAKVVAYHGWSDPLAKAETVVALATELTDAACDWQIHAYGHVVHGFTNPTAGSMNFPGIAYHEAAARRSWVSLKDYLAEIFGQG